MGKAFSSYHVHSAVLYWARNHPELDRIWPNRPDQSDLWLFFGLANQLPTFIDEIAAMEPLAISSVVGDMGSIYTE